MHRLFTRILIAIVAAAASSGAGADVGRLFFTPAERAELDAQRQSGGLGQSAAKSGSMPVRSVRVDGVVQRQRGASVVWVNGTRVEPTQGADAGLSVGWRADRSARVKVTVNSSHTRRLKPGQTWTPGSGRVEECFGCRTPPEPATTAAVVATPATADPTPAGQASVASATPPAPAKP